MGDQSSRRHRSDGRETRRALLKAAAELTAELGTGGITHRAVTERAGVPLSTASYYFASITELTEAAVLEFAADHVARVDGLTALFEAEQLEASDMADMIVETTANTDRVLLVAQFETYLQATRSPGVQRATEATLKAYERMAAAALAATGVKSPERYARWFTSITDGYLLQSLARDEPFDTAGFRGALEALFLGCAEQP